MATTGLDSIFHPRSIALIGATNREGTIGREILHNVIDLDFNGVLHAVNPRGGVVRSMHAYADVREIPGPVDLAIVVVPKDSVLDVVTACGAKDVKGLVIITAGFREIGGEGVEREARLVELLRQHKMRAIGPNCMGIINTAPDVRLNATFSRSRPLAGNVGFITQSGALGDAIIDCARDLNLGFSLFASIGNRADVSGIELLEYLAADERTDVILLYAEGFGAAREFIEVARRITPHKPIVAVKSGRTRAGARAALSHTGSIAGADAATDALFYQCGVLRVTTVEEMFDVAQVLSRQPLPAGDRVGIVTNAGGPGIMATDAVVSSGLKLAELAPATERAMRGKVLPDASLHNPIDLIASATPDHYKLAVSALLADPAVDMLLAIFVPIVMVDHAAVARAILSAWEPHRDKKPLLVCLMGRMEAGKRGVEAFHAAGVPVYEFPESAVHALAHAVEYVQARERLARDQKPPEFDVDFKRASELIENARKIPGGVMPFEDAAHLLAAYGIPLAETYSAASFEEAAEAADAVGYPVVLKIDAPGLSHKTDVGGVISDVRGVEELLAGLRRMRDAVKKYKLRGAQFEVQHMIRGGKELIIGVSRDPQLGHLIMCGLGGVYVEVISDIAFKLPPLTLPDAHDMLRSLRGYKLLEGVRGDPPVDVDFVAELICRISRLVTDHPDIEELDLNPVIACSRGADSRVVDVRLRVATERPHPDAKRRPGAATAYRAAAAPKSRSGRGKHRKK